MEKATNSVVRPEVRKENRLSVHAFLRDSYSLARKQLQGGIDAFRDELREIGQTAGACFDFFALPINNFLKDITQIEQEFQQPALTDTGQPDVHVVTITEALSSGKPMEENY